MVSAALVKKKKSVSAKLIPFTGYLWATGSFPSKISCYSEPESLFILIRVCSSLSLCFFFLSLTPSLPLSLPCSLFLQEGLLISPENHLMFLTEGEQQRRDTLYSQECHLNLAIPRPEDTHARTHDDTHTHTHARTHAHTHTLTNTHSSDFLHTHSHTPNTPTHTFVRTFYWLASLFESKTTRLLNFCSCAAFKPRKVVEQTYEKNYNFVHFCSFVGFISKHKQICDPIELD